MKQIYCKSYCIVVYYCTLLYKALLYNAVSQVWHEHVTHHHQKVPHSIPKSVHIKPVSLWTTCTPCHVKCSIDVITWCSFSWDDARDCNNNKIQTFYMLAMIQIYTTKHHTHSARLCHRCSQKLLDLFPFIITKARMVFYRTQEAVNHTKNNT